MSVWKHPAIEQLSNPCRSVSKTLITVVTLPLCATCGFLAIPCQASASRQSCPFPELQSSTCCYSAATEVPAPLLLSPRQRMVLSVRSPIPSPSQAIASEPCLPCQSCQPWLPFPVLDKVARGAEDLRSLHRQLADQRPARRAATADGESSVSTCRTQFSHSVISHRQPPATVVRSLFGTSAVLLPPQFAPCRPGNRRDETKAFWEVGVQPAQLPLSTGPRSGGAHGCRSQSRVGYLGCTSTA